MLRFYRADRLQKLADGCLNAAGLFVLYPEVYPAKHGRCRKDSDGNLPGNMPVVLLVFCFFSTDAESPHSVPLVLDMTLAHQSSFEYIALPLRIGRVDDLSAIY